MEARFLADGRPFRISGVVFDFDGTLTKPGAIDFSAIHEAVGCPRSIGLLEFLAGIEDPEERRRKEAVLTQAEAGAAARCEINDGAEELVALLRERQIPMAIITRNSLEAIDTAFTNLPGIDRAGFAAVLTRDLPLNPKPFPDAVEHVARELGLDVAELLVIGDHDFDMEAGRRAGTLTMFLRNNRDTAVPRGADFAVNSLKEAEETIRYGLTLPLGKLPQELLKAGLDLVAVVDSAVLVGARLGEDAAAIDISGDEVLVLSSDPVTLATEELARYTIQVNANDVATSGADPRWLLATLLFPPGSSGSQVLALMRDIERECASCGLTLCGGHTEISGVVSRPLVIGMVAGVTKRESLLDKRRMRAGDHILLTKAVAVEGTGLLARELPRRLLAAGIGPAEIAEAAGFLERIGVLDEARIARSTPGVSAMHDVTEGGLATAVRELGAAGGCRLRLDLGAIPIYSLTRRVCAALDLDPLGLIGSGSLLLTCSPAGVAPLCEAIRHAGIEITDIGEVLDEGEGVEATLGGASAPWPFFSRDEVSKLER